MRSIGSAKRRTRTQAIARATHFESLESRRLLSLLGIAPNPPLIPFTGSDTGALTYSASTKSFDSTATPTAILFPEGTFQTVQDPSDFELHIKVNNDGSLQGSGTAANDLVIAGWIDMNNDGIVDDGDYTGTLLTGKVSQIGFQDNGGGVAEYDARFTVTGGALDVPGLFAGQDIALLLTSEGSTFQDLNPGDPGFTADFPGGSKGLVGATAELNSLSGVVYNDLNNNGVNEAGEPGINGDTVTLTGTDENNNAVSLVTTTSNIGGVDGSYSFGLLAPGTYTITESQPAGYLDGIDSNGSLGGTVGNDVISNIVIPDTTNGGTNGINYNFGEILPSTISGTVYLDVNGNGVDNSEPGLAGIPVTVSGTNDLGAMISIPTTTGSDGSYSVSGLRPGTYTVTETPPAGYVLDAANTGSLGGTPAIGNVSSITVAPGQTGANYNFGQFQTGSIAGNVYLDANDNGTDNSEAGIGSVTVSLTGTDNLGNAVSATQLTGPGGTYLFAGINPGSYTVTETQPAGYLNSVISANAGSLGGTAGVNTVTTIPVNSGQSGQNYNFGEILPSSIAGNVYLDSNSNGVDNSEPGIASVTITLTGTNDLGAGVSASTTTAANGTYSFSGLRPGTYKLTETQPAGYTAETANPGSLGGTGVIGMISSIPVAQAVAGMSYNFGELVVPTNSISGTVYSDISGNGLTADDTPLSGVVVDLYKDINGNGVLDSGDGAPVATYTVGANGQYSFTSLPAGNYIVAETVPTNDVETAPNLPDYYDVAVTTSSKTVGLNFDNYVPCNVSVQNVSFKINGCTTVSDLRGNTAQGETVTVTFTVPAGSSPMVYSLATYNAPDSTFNASDASQQTIFQDATATFGPGVHTLTVTIPSNYYQIDFVCGAAIDTLGPAGSNIFYSAQHRLISADNAGLHSDVEDESATMLFWANLGQTLIKNFGGSSTNTALGNWLATTMPNVFGGTVLGNKTNATIASKYMSYYNVSGQKNTAQVMATLLNVYASTLSLGGAAATPFGFDVTAAGLGAADFNVGSNGAAFGIANNATITVSQMLSACNAKSSNGNLYNGVSSLLNAAYNEFGQVNGDGGIN